MDTEKSPLEVSYYLKQRAKPVLDDERDIGFAQRFFRGCYRLFLNCYCTAINCGEAEDKADNEIEWGD